LTIENEELVDQEEIALDHITKNEEAPQPGRVLELDVFVKPVSTINHAALALYSSDGK